MSRCDRWVGSVGVAGGWSQWVWQKCLMNEQGSVDPTGVESYVALTTPVQVYCVIWCHVMPLCYLHPVAGCCILLLFVTKMVLTLCNLHG